MYGRRARIGLIVPSSNTVCEQEMAALCPPDVATFSTRILFKPTLESLRDMKNHVERATRELASEDICDLIAFCCTVGSMIDGPDYDRFIIEQIEKNSGIKATATTSAVKAALNTLAVERIAVATPYTRAINRIEEQVLTGMGYRITNLIGYHDHVAPSEFKNDMIGRLEPEQTYQLALSVDSDENEAIFISCTNLRAIEIIQRLEQETGKPVITSNQAAMWHALRRLGIDDVIEGFGRLFEL